MGGADEDEGRKERPDEEVKISPIAGG